MDDVCSRCVFVRLGQPTAELVNKILITGSECLSCGARPRGIFLDGNPDKKTPWPATLSIADIKRIDYTCPVCGQKAVHLTQAESS